MTIGQNETDANSSGNRSLIQPWLPVFNGAEAIAFYRAAFGAAETYHLESPDGSVVAKLNVNGAEFWVSGGTADSGNAPDMNQRAEGARMILIVSDPDTFFSAAVGAGAQVVFPVGEEYGWRLGRLVDPFGYHWEIGHPLATS